MKVLVVGSGGREHTLAWKLAQSPRVEQVYVAPGNAGTTWEDTRALTARGPTGLAPSHNVPIDVMDIAGLLAFAQETGIDLTVVGPEAPLVAGIGNAFIAQGLHVFGPTQAAAQLESDLWWSTLFPPGRPSGSPSMTAPWSTYARCVHRS
jgi:phosphoribosylamine--glycine ligase